MVRQEMCGDGMNVWMATLATIEQTECQLRVVK